ncbi:hypothetical protein [Nocardia vulneris]|uniref:MarR family transcriptional regulator n=1 Tax=Nocardia vulneris TaxID=1141657 RepID=A0ABR4Z6E9_9NOCA|nr:hypothetical protein [Nocardia vulneris]KIA60834.1 hypothetical protein FG87_34685 [Nocardia vulneris]
MENNHNSTAPELADIAGISASTARKILARWSAEGRVKRFPRSDPRSAARWVPFPASTEEPVTHPGPGPTGSDTPVDEPDSASTESIEPPQTSDPAPESGPAVDDDSADSQPGTDEPEATPADPASGTTDADADSDAADKPNKLAPGALRGQVEDHLREHPVDEFTPHQIGKELHRSSGAVHNALMKLTANGVAAQTSTAPKKFRLASA